MRSFATAAIIFALIATASCRKPQSNQTAGVSDTTGTPSAATAAVPETPDTARSPADFGYDQRQQFIGSIRQQLADLDRQVQDLSAQAKSRGGSVSDRALSRIRASQRAAENSLNRLNTATAANWDQLKRGVNQAVDNLSESIEAAQPK